MFDLSEDPCCDHRNELCGNKSYGNSINTDPVNLLPDQNSGKGRRQNHNRIFKEGNEACYGCFLYRFIIAHNKFIPEIRNYTDGKNTKCIHHLSAKLSAAASKQDRNLFCKCHDNCEYHCQDDVTVFQHFITQNPDPHIILFTKEDPGYIWYHTNNSTCQHFNDQQYVIADGKYRHALFSDLIDNDRIKTKCLDKIRCHENKHRHTRNNGFHKNPKVLCLQPDKTYIPFIGTDIKQENKHCQQKAKHCR